MRSWTSLTLPGGVVPFALRTLTFTTGPLLRRSQRIRRGCGQRSLWGEVDDVFVVRVGWIPLSRRTVDVVVCRSPHDRGLHARPVNVAATHRPSLRLSDRGMSVPT